MSVNPSHYFDLTQPLTKLLFFNSNGNELDYVWQALDSINHFFELLPLKTAPIDTSLFPNVFFDCPERIFTSGSIRIEPGAYIRGPCFLGDGSIIRHGAYIRGGVILDERAIVGHSTEVKNSILLSNAKAPHFSYVGDSILGANTNLGAGVKCANLKLQSNEIAISLGSSVISTGRRKLGVILGDGSQVGCNTVINPGTLIGKGAVCFPNLSISGYHKPHKTIIESNV